MNYPMINGYVYGWSEIVISVMGIPIRGVKSINYSESVERGVARGTSQRKLGFTNGEYDCEADIELLMADWLALIKLLGPGYMNMPFMISVSYVSAQGFTTDVLAGVKIKKVGNSHSQGNEPLSISLDLDVMSILRDSKDALMTP